MVQVPESEGPALNARPSVSAFNVALCRAAAANEPREAIRGRDTLAEVFLTPEGQASLKNPAIHGLIRSKLQETSPGGYEFFIARTAYLDAVVERALREHVAQLVFLGSGYDTRAYRFRELLGPARVFDLDMPATHAHKRSLLAQAGVADPEQLTYVPIDFTHDSMLDLLGAAGYAEDRQTLFIWEGVTYYLPAATVDATFDFIRRHAPPGSVVCFDYMLPASALEGRYGGVQSREEMAAMYADEPLQFELAPEAVEEYLTARGYRLVEHLSTADMQARYLTLPDGTLAGQVLDLFGLVRAELVG